jgi:hypothetical protein
MLTVAGVRSSKTDLSGNLAGSARNFSQERQLAAVNSAELAADVRTSKDSLCRGRAASNSIFKWASFLI